MCTEYSLVFLGLLEELGLSGAVLAGGIASALDFPVFLTDFIYFFKDGSQAHIDNFYRLIFYGSWGGVGCDRRVKGATGINFDWGCSSVGRALDLHSRGLGFNSPQLHFFIFHFMYYHIYLIILPLSPAAASFSCSSSSLAVRV